jgi:hypothetical protein
LEADGPAPGRGFWVRTWTSSNWWTDQWRRQLGPCPPGWWPPIGVRNIFNILGCHERHDTTWKSLDKAKFTSVEGCAPWQKSLGSKHTGW